MSSWLSKNYEKAAVGGAVVAALGLAFLGWLKVGGVQEEFSTLTKGEGKNEPAVVAAPIVAKAASSLARKLSWPQGETTENRAVDLFTGIPLFIKREAPETSVDLLRSEPVHPPIPNPWWIEHRLDPGFGDSPTRDPDGEGFTNLEEFEGKTNPADAKSHPPLIGKLMYQEDESLEWALRPSFPEGENCPFTYRDAKSNTNKTSPNPPVKPGGLFFVPSTAKNAVPKPAENRFKFLNLETRNEMNRGTGVEQPTTYAKVEDQKPNKKGMIYEYKVAYPDGDIQKWSKFDRSAVMSLEAIGNEGKRESIEEFTRFGLPFDSPNKDYLLKKVTPDEIEVEHTDPKTGVKTLYKASKGGFPTKVP